MDLSQKRLKSYDKRAWLYLNADLNFRFPFEDGVADAVVANQVIEYIVDPLHFAREIYRILKKSGRCVIATPNIRYLKHIADLLMSGYGPLTAGENTLDGAWDDGHVYYFTHRDLQKLFAKIGFRRIEGRALIDLECGGWLRRWMDRHSTASPIKEFLSGCILLWAEK